MSGHESSLSIRTHVLREQTFATSGAPRATKLLGLVNLSRRNDFAFGIDVPNAPAGTRLFLVAGDLPRIRLALLGGRDGFDDDGGGETVSVSVGGQVYRMRPEQFQAALDAGRDVR